MSSRDKILTVGVTKNSYFQIDCIPAPSAVSPLVPYHIVFLLGFKQTSKSRVFPWLDYNADHILQVLHTTVCLQFCPLDCHSFHTPPTSNPGQLWPRPLPVWIGLSSNCRPTCTTASWDMNLLLRRLEKAEIN